MINDKSITANFSIDIVNIENINPTISRYKCYICYPDEPANNFIFSKKVLEEMAPSIVGTGIYTYYSEKLEMFGGHYKELIYNNGKIDKTGNLFAIGFIDTATMPFWEKRIVNGKEREYLTAYAYLWSYENPLLKDLDKLEVFQSMEVFEDDEKINGYTVVKKAMVRRLVLVGSEPAFIGSKFEKFTKNEKSLENLKKVVNNINKDIASIIMEQSILENKNNNKKIKQMEDNILKEKYINMKNTGKKFSTMFSDCGCEIIDTYKNKLFSMKDGKFISYSCKNEKYSEDNSILEDCDLIEEESNSILDFIKYSIDKLEEFDINNSNMSKSLEDTKILNYDLSQKFEALKLEKDNLFNEFENYKINNEDSTSKLNEKNEEVEKLKNNIVELKHTLLEKEIKDLLNSPNFVQTFTAEENKSFLDDCVNFTKEENEMKIWAAFGKKCKNSQLNKNSNFTKIDLYSTHLDKNDNPNDDSEGLYNKKFNK